MLLLLPLVMVGGSQKFFNHDLWDYVQISLNGDIPQILKTSTQSCKNESVRMMGHGELTVMTKVTSISSLTSNSSTDRQTLLKLLMGIPPALVGRSQGESQPASCILNPQTERPAAEGLSQFAAAHLE